MSIRITRTGLLDTIQDSGRYGYQHTGINPGGAMDRVAMQVANMLVGNDPSEAVIEMYFPAAEILFEETTLIALTGADFSAKLDDAYLPICHPVIIAAGSLLKFTKRIKGAVAYIAFKGGISIDRWLNSKSTNLIAKTGGWNGRALQKNDRMELRGKSIPNTETQIFSWSANVADLYSDNPIRFIAGNEFTALEDGAKKQLEQPFIIGKESNRMGFRLEGAPLFFATGEMISTAVTRGTMQLLPNGQLIILMADHQTTGGYPVVGHIIGADLPSVAQKNPGDQIRFQQLSVSDAEQAFLTQQMNLRQLQNACNFRL